jgi:hypothetical protein
MTSKKQRIIMYTVAASLLLIAIVSYAAFPVQAPEEPIRLMYATNAGKVLFDHKTHASKMGFALACADCHHHPDDGDIDAVGCGKCHPVESQEGVVPEYCLECHDVSEVEDAQYPKRSDAFHLQCIGCHDQFDKGPGSGSENCSKCHVL